MGGDERAMYGVVRWSALALDRAAAQRSVLARFGEVWFVLHAGQAVRLFPSDGDS